VIPAVETTEPLSAEVASPANVPVETVDTTAATTNGETKKEVKSDKRKSSLPFAFGGKKSPDADTEKKPFFSKLRQTVKGKPTAAKTEEKPVEKATEDKPAETTATETSAAAAATEPVATTGETTEAAKVTETPAVEETKPAAPAATAPVTAAA
jgi:hypothetical protein